MAAQDQDQARLRRKLNSTHRLQMAHLAKERFRCPDLRAIEAATRETMIAAFMAGATAIPKREIEILKKHGYASEVEFLDLPTGIYVRQTGSRTFKRPDGVEVTREGAGKPRYVSEPGDDDRELPAFSTWREALETKAERRGGSRHFNAIRLPKPVTIPGQIGPCSNSDGYGEASGRRVASVYTAGRYNNTAPENEKEMVAKNRLSITDCASRTVLTPEFEAALTAYFVAADERILAERRLIVAAIAVIAQCTTYGQAIDFWPEVEELEEAMFGKPIIPPAFSLVALSDEDKQALCANMAERGVAGAACKRMAA